MASDSHTFPLFSSLPPELRQQIWYEAISDQAPSIEAQPVIYFYKEGLWDAQSVTPWFNRQRTVHSGPCYYTLNFRHLSLDTVQIEFPLLSVNNEAARVVVRWIYDQSPITRLARGRQGSLGRSFLEHCGRTFRSSVFGAHFHPTHDILYIPPERWDEFLSGPEERCSRWDIHANVIFPGPVQITSIAVPEALFKDENAFALIEMIVSTKQFGGSVQK